MTIPDDPAAPALHRTGSGPADLKTLRRAAEAGDAAAQFNLGVLCDSRVDDNGYDIPGDRTEALHWLLRAAGNDLPRAQLRLAEIYADSPPASGDRVRACAWFVVAIARLTGAQRAAAEAGFRVLAGQLSATRMVKARALATRLTKSLNSISPGPRSA
jgi:TPR repeat protein